MFSYEGPFGVGYLTGVARTTMSPSSCHDQGHRMGPTSSGRWETITSLGPPDHRGLCGGKNAPVEGREECRAEPEARGGWRRKGGSLSPTAAGSCDNIGTIIPRQNLGEEIANAIEFRSRDPRFAPVRQSGLPI